MVHAMTTVKAALLACALLLASTASAHRPPPRRAPAPSAITDADILNFALNLEYLEANFYSCAAYGQPLNSSLSGGGPTPIGCQKAVLSEEAQEYAVSIADDEIAHVALLRAALGAAAVKQPQIDIGPAFVAAANAAVGATLNPPFDAYANDILFYHAAFIFEDVGVTAYKGAAPLLSSKSVLETAAGILAVEAYHGGAIRSELRDIANLVVFPYKATVKAIVGAISALRAAAAGAADDQGLYDMAGNFIVAPSDANGVAYSRSVTQVLNIVTLGGGHKGGFFPNGLNGKIN